MGTPRTVQKTAPDTKSPTRRKGTISRNKGGKLGCLPLFAVLFLLPALLALGYAFYLQTSLIKSVDFSAYTKSAGLYFTQMFMGTIGLIVTLLLASFFAYWIYRKARLRPPNTTQGVTRLKRLLVLTAVLCLILFGFGTVWATESYYAYLDWQSETTLNGQFLGLTEGGWNTRMLKFQTPSQIVVLKCSADLPGVAKLRWKDTLTVHYGVKTNRIFAITR